MSHDFENTADVTIGAGPPSTVRSSIVVDGVGSPAIQGVVVSVDIDHTWDGDLTLSVLNPAGRRVVLADRRGGNRDHFRDTVFDDAAPLPNAYFSLDQVKRTTQVLFVRAGSRDETAEVSGVSHFLEHMAFKGDDRFSADDVNRVFDEIGAKYNASTSEEVTMYYAAVLPEYLERAMELLSSLMQPALRVADFEMEKNVILEEISMYEDQPSFVCYDHIMSTHFAGHPLCQSILGTNASITALTPVPQ